MKKEPKIITICSSVSFYREALEVERRLKNKGFKVKLPEGAIKLRKSNFDPEEHKKRYQDRNNWKEKSSLIKSHFRKVLSADAILVVNSEKHGAKGYIGGNVLMEMTLAFHYKKPIYILNPIDERLPLKEEIYGMHPVFIKNDIANIK